MLDGIGDARTFTIFVRRETVYAVPRLIAITVGFLIRRVCTTLATANAKGAVSNSRESNYARAKFLHPVVFARFAPCSSSAGLRGGVPMF